MNQSSISTRSGDMWRMVTDFRDTNGHSSMVQEFEAAYNRSVTSGITHHGII
ncbi:MAG: hypothetical protein JXX14_14020 [Deltaproteobacteria bacterium]|nr:hypothetical protein [Deltaproteobacteria bacterium]